MSTNQYAQSATEAELAELDNLLGNLDLTSGGSVEVEELIELAEEAIEGNVLEELVIDDTELRKVEADLERQEVYQEQEAPAPIAQPVAAATPSKTKAAKTPRAPSAPRAQRDLNSLAPEVFVLEGAAPADPAELARVKAETLALMPAQKKIAEKFENLFVSLAAGRLPSTFITQAFGILDTKTLMSSADLVAAYKMVGSKSDTEGYNEGTARSQCGQIMHLFETVKIAKRTRQELELNKNSNLANRLRDILKSA